MMMRQGIKMCKQIITQLQIKKILDKFVAIHQLKVQERQKELRRVWRIFHVKMQFNITIKRKGKTMEFRTRQIIRQAVTLEHALLNRGKNMQATRIIKLCLSDLAKREQLKIKIKLTLDRILKMQHRFTFALKCKQDLHEQVQSKIWASLHDLRNIIQTEKTFKTDFKTASEYINMVVFKHKEIVNEIARLYILLPSFIHSTKLNLANLELINRVYQPGSMVWPVP